MPNEDAAEKACENTASPFAVNISRAAKTVGMSHRQFRRVFIDTGRVQLIYVSERTRIIDYTELMRAYAALKESHRGKAKN